MEFRQLESFVAVVNNRSFSKAAKQLYLSQPTITAHVNDLERELSCSLLLRSTRGVELTEAGQTCYNYAQDILTQRQALYRELLGTTDEPPVLRIATSTVPAISFLPTCIAGFRQRFPHVVFQMLQGNSASTCDLVKRHQVQLGFTGVAPTDPELASIPIAQDELVLITANVPRFHLVDRAKNPVVLLNQENLLRRSDGSGTDNEVRRLLESWNQPVKVAAELPTSEAQLAAVAADAGVAIVSAVAASDYINFGRVLAFPLGEQGKRFLYMIRSKQRPMDRDTAAFYKHVAQNRTI